MIHTGYGKKTDRTGLNVSSLSLRLKKARTYNKIEKET